MPRRAPPHAFRPGESGNPNGRPPGVGPAAKLRAALAEREAEIVEAVIQAALAGDTAAAKLVLDRVCPPLRPESAPVRLTLPEGDLAGQGRAVLRAVAAGRIGIHEGSALLATVAALARVVETGELAARIEALERRAGDAPGA